MSLFGGGGGGLFGGAAPAGAAGGVGAMAPVQNPNQNGSYEVPNPPTDSISCLAWSGQQVQQDLLAAGSWDNTVTVWQVQWGQAGAFGGAQPPQIAAQAMAQYKHDGPVLCCNFSKDGSIVVSGGCDNSVRIKNLAQNPQSQDSVIIGKHDMPVKEVFFTGPEMNNMVISGSWDKTIRFWNPQQPGQEMLRLDLPERVYSMDMNYPMLVVGCAERQIICYNLEQVKTGNKTPMKTGQTALKMQTRCVAWFPDQSGYAVGSIEGRCSIVYHQTETKNFAFKCHRSNEEIFAVNAISFHPTHGTFATAGSDGMFTFWDKDNRQRLKQFATCHYPITATKFSARGNLFWYWVCYDWSKGHEHNNANIPRKIFLHAVNDEDVRPKAAQNTNRNRR